MDAGGAVWAWGGDVLMKSHAMTFCSSCVTKTKYSHSNAHTTSTDKPKASVPAAAAANYVREIERENSFNVGRSEKRKKENKR